MNEIKLERVGNFYNTNWGTGLPGNVWNPNYICPTITTCQGGGREPHILVVDKINRQEAERIINASKNNRVYG